MDMELTAEERAERRGEIEVIRVGVDAAKEVTSDRPYTRWIDIGNALTTIRKQALRESHSNSIKSGGYAKAFNRILADYPALERIDKNARSKAMKVIDNQLAIEAWRATLPLEKKMKWNHPVAVLSNWERQTKPKAPNQPTAAEKRMQREAEIRDEAVAQFARENDDSLFSAADSDDDIANVLFQHIAGQASVAKAERVARAILKRVKEAKVARS